MLLLSQTKLFLMLEIAQSKNFIAALFRLHAVRPENNFPEMLPPDRARLCSGEKPLLRFTVMFRSD